MIINIKCSKTDCDWNVHLDAKGLSERRIYNLTNAYILTHIRKSHGIYPIVREIIPVEMEKEKPFWKRIESMGFVITDIGMTYLTTLIAKKDFDASSIEYYREDGYFFSVISVIGKLPINLSDLKFYYYPNTPRQIATGRSVK